MLGSRQWIDGGRLRTALQKCPHAWMRTINHRGHRGTQAKKRRTERLDRQGTLRRTGKTRKFTGGGFCDGESGRLGSPPSRGKPKKKATL